MNLMILLAAVETARRMKVKPNWDKLMTTLAISEEYLLKLNPVTRYEIIRQLLSHPNFDDTDVYYLAMLELEDSSEKPVQRENAGFVSIGFGVQKRKRSNTIRIFRAKAETPALVVDPSSSSCSVTTIKAVDGMLKAETPALVVDPSSSSCSITTIKPVDGMPKAKTLVLENVKKPISLRVMMGGRPVNEIKGDDAKEKKVVNKNTKKRVVSEREEAEEELKAKKTKKNKPVLPDQPTPELPESFREHITTVLHGTELSLVIQKKVFNTDVSDRHDRFSVPAKQVKNKFLKKNEDPGAGVPARILYISPDTGFTSRRIVYKSWKMTANFIYNLMSGWNKVKYESQLRAGEGKNVQLWSFRVDQQLWFALVKIPPEEVAAEAN